MLGLGRNMALAIGRKGAAGFLEPIEDVPSGEFSDPDNPKIVEEDLPNGVEVSRVARSYNNSGNPPSTPPGLSGSAGNGQVTWTVTPGEGVDGIRLYDAEILPSRRSDESPDSNEASATPQEPTQPNTGSEWVVLEADSITGNVTTRRFYLASGLTTHGTTEPCPKPVPPMLRVEKTLALTANPV